MFTQQFKFFHITVEDANEQLQDFSIFTNKPAVIEDVTNIFMKAIDAVVKSQPDVESVEGALDIGRRNLLAGELQKRNLYLINSMCDGNIHLDVSMIRNSLHIDEMMGEQYESSESDSA